MTIETRCLFWALAGIATAVLADIFLIHLFTGSWGG